MGSSLHKRVPMRWSKRSVATVAVLLVSCVTYQVRRTLHAPAEASLLDRAAPYIKVHMRDGRAYVLSPWRVDQAARRVIGTGQLLDARRDVVVLRDSFSIPIDSVALFETNRMQASPATGALTVMTGLTMAVAVACLTNPKACFGSCPTFYVTDGSAPRLMAEGFSASVAPALEASDIDALFHARPASRDLEVRLTNEALETHVVRRARILAARRPPGGRVFATDAGAFMSAGAVVPAIACRAAEGDCTGPLAAFDARERFSRADSSDLAAREIVDLEFPRPDGGRLGLVVASRQTLLTTWLFYQALAFMGTRTVEWLAALERADSATLARAAGIGRRLGGIEVLVQGAGGDWEPAGRTAETGPIATDVRLVTLPDTPGSGPVRVRLRLTRGAWRLDWVALAALGTVVTPVALDPIRVTRDGRDDTEALASLLDSARALTTFPGDALTLWYRLPPDPGSWELFLDSRGYYLEWMREAWLREENAVRAAQMFLDPAGALRHLARPFSRAEPTLEAAFWRSRYVQR